MLAVRIEKMKITLKETGKVSVVRVSDFKGLCPDLLTLLSHQIRISDCLLFLTRHLGARYPPNTPAIPSIV